MGTIFNIRGTAGSGKTEVVRRVLSASDIRCKVVLDGAGPTLPPATLIHGRGRTLAIIGSYDARSGGCDRIKVSQGGIGAALSLAEHLASAGHDVVIEGLHLSWEVVHSRRLGKQAALEVLRLDTPAEHCAEALARRRRRGIGEVSALLADVERQAALIVAACSALMDVATVRRCHFDEAQGAIFSGLCGPYNQTFYKAPERLYGP